ncbi:hypothetical protein TBLA_0C05140 [Henningerozyma blattae CBS 6284]|uniref:protein-serine/threonine phosphatase n=1 Tax=Henningerozyma blattae (strain ATCC 34711 / CBS 6284 / DSM 70876 / NBRC 10599 / NRRL Y-10934 / UCD 77-7) TaxID=1071380 RepID=I2H1Q8_HENB6|nr:hypothetical protein TBLA_0C05140 [Tetrapisispora blattae CBS 6284]CCH60310.1 hypothetical protein TBLA_0C05140 [Tetrapisispora blattae CBS 6284]
MGQILSNPIIDKEHHSGNDILTAFGLCAMQGWRMSMEDSHIVELNISNTGDDKEATKDDSEKDHLAYYSVFDGHGGSGVAQYCGDNNVRVLREQENFKKGNYEQAMIDTFLALDEELLKDPILKNDHSGCTATTLLISKLQNSIICANSGDSRTVLSSNGIAKALSFDHKPTLASEKSRIVAAKGFVEMDRVNGNLALSRAIGDFEFKLNNDLSPYEQIVTCVPDIIKHELDYKNDEFVILACDGIWDCLSSQDCVDIIHYAINNTTMNLNEISSKIIDVCCSPTTAGTGIGCDNMSIVIVALLKDGESIEEWSSRIRNKNKNSTNKTNKTNQDISFEERRKKIYPSFAFPNDDIFAITTKKINHNDDMDIDETDDDAAGSENGNKRGNKSRSTGGVTARNGGGPVDLFSLEALLGAGGIQISQGPNDQSFIHGAALNEMLASLSGGNRDIHETENSSSSVGKKQIIEEDEDGDSKIEDVTDDVKIEEVSNDVKIEEISNDDSTSKK